MPSSTKPESVTIIRHHTNAVELTDNAIIFFQKHGIDYRFVNPYLGEKLHPDKVITPTIVLGGGQNVTELSKHDYLRDELVWIESCFKQEVPIIGICLGAQLMAHALGARVWARQPAQCEFGLYEVRPTTEAKGWLDAPQLFMQAHYQEFELPDNAVRLAASEAFPEQAFRYGRCAYAMQFHPEVHQAILDDWHADTWSDQMVATSGAQSYANQQALAAKHLPLQSAWLDRFLTDLLL